MKGILMPCLALVTLSATAEEQQAGCCCRSVRRAQSQFVTARGDPGLPVARGARLHLHWESARVLANMRSTTLQGDERGRGP
jgi:hypothetical protein